MKPKVLIGIPTMSSMHPFLASVLFMWQAKGYQTGAYNLGFYPTMSVSPVDHARNEIVETFLESEYTHLFFIDSDTIPPVDALDKLLSHNLPIVTGITPIIDFNETTKEFYRVWNCWLPNDQRVKPKSGMQKIKGAGSSCILIKKEVFESLEKPYYRFVYEDDNGKQIKQIGEDVRFTAMAQQKGYEIWADTDVICQHYKSTIW